VEQIWHRHCREREHEHSQQMSVMRTQLGTMKAQMSKLRREMANLEAEIRSAEKNRMKEVAREKELTERFQQGFDKVYNYDDVALLFMTTSIFQGYILSSIKRLIISGPATMWD